MNYGFIGTGNIANAIVTGIIKSKFINPTQIYVYDIQETSLNAFVSTFGVNGCSNAIELIEHVDILFLSIKPNVYSQVLPQLQEALNKHNVVLVSLAAGQTLASIEAMLAHKIPIVRVMPNVNAVVCEAVNALCCNEVTTIEQKQEVKTFFDHTGLTMELPESQFGIFSAIAGCSPAFTYLYIDSLAKGAQKNGMNKKQALQIATQAVLGSAKMLLESDQHPWELIDKVCSPGGVTIEGICTLEDFRFESAVVHAVDAAIKKDSSMK